MLTPLDYLYFLLTALTGIYIMMMDIKSEDFVVRLVFRVLGFILTIGSTYHLLEVPFSILK